MKTITTIIKLAIVAVLINGAWQVFNAYWPFYKFKDAVNFTTQFRGDKSDEQVRAKILELATQFDVPVNDDNLVIRREEKHTIVDASYKRDIVFVPGVKYSWPFTLHTDTFTYQATNGEELIPK
jgi:hypothetical protein